MLINDLLPAIRQQWPTGNQMPITIQQDNSRAHIKVDDPEFMAAACMDGFEIAIKPQSPNSSDTNALDLGLFCVIETKQHIGECIPITSRQCSYPCSFV